MFPRMTERQQIAYAMQMSAVSRANSNTRLVTLKGKNRDPSVAMSLSENKENEAKGKSTNVKTLTGHSPKSEKKQLNEQSVNVITSHTNSLASVVSGSSDLKVEIPSTKKNSPSTRLRESSKSPIPHTSTSKTRNTTSKSTKLSCLPSKLVTPCHLSWNSTRRNAWEKLSEDPNFYYQRYCPPGERMITAQWTNDEIELFKAIMVTRPPWDPIVRFDTVDKVIIEDSAKWGLFSLHIPGRTGNQCEKLYRSLLKEKKSGELLDETYRALGLRFTSKHVKICRLRRRMCQNSLVTKTRTKRKTRVKSQFISQTTTSVQNPTQVVKTSTIQRKVSTRPQKSKKKIQTNPKTENFVKSSKEIQSDPLESFEKTATKPPKRNSSPSDVVTNAIHSTPSVKATSPLDKPLEENRKSRRFRQQMRNKKTNKRSAPKMATNEIFPKDNKVRRVSGSKHCTFTTKEIKKRKRNDDAIVVARCLFSNPKLRRKLHHFCKDKKSTINSCEMNSIPSTPRPHTLMPPPTPILSHSALNATPKPTRKVLNDSFNTPQQSNLNTIHTPISGVSIRNTMVSPDCLPDKISTARPLHPSNTEKSKHVALPIIEEICENNISQIELSNKFLPYNTSVGDVRSLKEVALNIAKSLQTSHQNKLKEIRKQRKKMEFIDVETYRKKMDNASLNTTKKYSQNNIDGVTCKIFSHACYNDIDFKTPFKSVSISHSECNGEQIKQITYKHAIEQENLRSSFDEQMKQNISGKMSIFRSACRDLMHYRKRNRRANFLSNVQNKSNITQKSLVCQYRSAAIEMMNRQRLELSAISSF